MFFTIAVDDFACFPREEKHFQELVQVLNKKYTTKVAGNLNGHLEMKVNEYADGSVGLSQPKTLQAIFNLFDIADDDPGVETPMRVDFNDEEQDKGEKIDMHRNLPKAAWNNHPCAEDSRRYRLRFWQARVPPAPMHRQGSSRPKAPRKIPEKNPRLRAHVHTVKQRASHGGDQSIRMVRPRTSSPH